MTVARSSVSRRATLIAAVLAGLCAAPAARAGAARPDGVWAPESAIVTRPGDRLAADALYAPIRRAIFLRPAILAPAGRSRRT